MRAIWFSWVCILITLAVSATNEMNTLHMVAKGYPLIPYGDTGSANTGVAQADLNTTMANYGLDRVPSQSGTNYYLGTGGTLLDTYNLFKDVFLFTTLGFSQFIETAFPSMQPGLKILLDVSISLNNLVGIIAFFRGVALKYL
jgi:hypothetical protein